MSTSANQKALEANPWVGRNRHYDIVKEGTIALLVEPAPTPLEGNWSNPSGSVITTIAPCGDAMCGRVQWASDKAIADARRGGTSTLVGTELLSGLTQKGEGRWRGRIFVPDMQKRSTVELRQTGPDQIRVTGCAVGRILCKSQVWIRSIVK